MSQLLTQFKLDYGKYFDQPPDPRESTPSTADPDNIFNFSNQLREDLQPTNGLAPKTTNPNSEKVSDIAAKFDKEVFAGDGVVVKKGKKSFIKVQA